MPASQPNTLGVLRSLLHATRCTTRIHSPTARMPTKTSTKRSYELRRRRLKAEKDDGVTAPPTRTRTDDHRTSTASSPMSPIVAFARKNFPSDTPSREKTIHPHKEQPRTLRRLSFFVSSNAAEPLLGIYSRPAYFHTYTEAVHGRLRWKVFHGSHPFTALGRLHGLAACIR